MNPKKRTSLLVLFVLLTLPGCRPAAGVSYESVPVGGAQATARAPRPTPAPSVEQQSAADLVPEGYYLLKSAEGDLNGDERPDVAVVFGKTKPGIDKHDASQAKTDLETARPLVIAFRGADGRLERAGASAKAVLCRECGGMFDEPLLDLKIERGAVVVDQATMGSGVEVSYTHRFRYRDGEWRLIGETIETTDRGGKGTTVKDTNYSTGLMTIETRDIDDEPLDKQSRRVSNDQPHTLAAFDIEQASGGNR